MRHLLLLALLLASACGGTWSNRDLDFIAALPTRSALASSIPASSSASQPLSRRRDGLNAGEPSVAYAETRKAVNDFNGILDFFLGVLDAVRTVPPTSRSGDSRTWGPFPARDNPGFDFQLTIALVGTEPQETFAWKLQARKAGTPGFFDVVRGAFQASPETVRKGMGQIEVPVKDFRDLLQVDAELRAIDTLVIGYFTTSYPHTSTLAFTFAPGNASGYSSLGYAAKRAEDGSGAMGFSLKGTDTNVSRLDVVSRWRSDGAGVSLAQVGEGAYRGATRAECWNAAFKVTFFKESWPGGKESGRQEDCVAVDGL